MTYKHFKDLFDADELGELTADKIHQAITGEEAVVLCLNKDGYYIDNLDEYFGEDDTIDVPTKMAEQVIALPGICTRTIKGVKVFQQMD